MEQLLLGLEVVQQARRADPGLLGDLPERDTAPTIARQQPLRHGQDPLPAVLALGEERGVRPLVRHTTLQSTYRTYIKLVTKT